MAFNPQTINKELDMANLAKHNANYSAIKTELDTQSSASSTHVASQTAHGSTSVATAGKIMQRDSAGRAKVAAPSALDDIARKAEVDAVQAGLDAHKADSIAHLTSVEHTKLAGVEEGAEVNQNAFAQVNNVVAGAESDALTIAGGIGITVSTNPTTKTVTVTATGEATPGAHGPSHNNDGADPIPDLVTLRDEFDALTPAGIGAETPTGAQAKVDALGAAIDTQLGESSTAMETHKAELVTDINGVHGLKIESGVFTPTLVGSIAEGTHFYWAQLGYYEKIGKTVNFHLYVEITEKDANMSGSVSITGLPFVTVNDNRRFISCSISHAVLTKGTKQLSARINQMSNSVDLLFIEDTTSNVAASAILSNSAFMISGTYQTF